MRGALTRLMGGVDLANIIDYVLWRGDLPARQVPLGEADALILSYLSYMPMDGIVPGEEGGEPVTLRDAALAMLERSERENGPLACSVKDDRRLLAALAQSVRFGTMRLCAFVNRLDGEAEEQFSAVTFLPPAGPAFIAYRGTDNTVVGWQEDFNMCFESEVPAQRDAVAYAERMAGTLQGGLILGGHSKGGNLAAYAELFVSAETHRRIQAVYNFDGPGFNEEIVASAAFAQRKRCVQTFVPQSSIVGVLMENDEVMTVVRSDGVGIFQHNPYTWQVMGGSFVALPERTDSSHFADATVKHWLSSLSPDVRRRAIDGIFEVLGASDGRNVAELFEPRKAMGVLRAAGSMDDETRRAVEETFRLLGEALGKNVSVWMNRTVNRTADDLRQRVFGERTQESRPEDDGEH